MNRAALAVAGFAILIGAGVWGAHEYASKRPAASIVQPTGAVTMASATAPVTPQTETFQPYTLVDQPAPRPAQVTDTCRHLTLRAHAGQEYLADPHGRYYHVGRDSRGHIYPAYYDAVTEQNYPLYYDPERDNYYRVCRSGGLYYESFVGDDASRFYACDNGIDYSVYAPPYDDCPIITDPYTTFTYYSEPPYYYHPAEYHRYWHDDDWLWAVPVLIGAYFLLDEHSYPGYGYYYCYNGGPFIERAIVRENCYNAPVTFFDRGRRVSFFANVRPPDEVMAPRDRWAHFENDFERSHPRFETSGRPRFVTAPPAHGTAWYAEGQRRPQTAEVTPRNGFAVHQGVHGPMQAPQSVAARQPGHNASNFRTAGGGHQIATIDRTPAWEAHRRTMASPNAQHFAARPMNHGHTAVASNRHQFHRPQTAMRTMPSQHGNRVRSQSAFRPSQSIYRPRRQTAFDQPRRVDQWQHNSGASSGFQPREYHMRQPRSFSGGGGGGGGGGRAPREFGRPSGGGGGTPHGGGRGGGGGDHRRH